MITYFFKSCSLHLSHRIHHDLFVTCKNDKYLKTTSEKHTFNIWPALQYAFACSFFQLWCTSHKKEDVVPALKRSLVLLQMSYVDNFLMHYPVAMQVSIFLIHYPVAMQVSIFLIHYPVAMQLSIFLMHYLMAMQVSIFLMCFQMYLLM